MTTLFNGAASGIGVGPWNTAQLGSYYETSTSCINNANPTPAGSRRCTLMQDPLGIKGQVFMSDLRVGDSLAITALAGSYRSEL